PGVPADCASDPSLFVPNTFLEFKDSDFKPEAKDRHEVPLLRPESGTSNYTNQLEQLNKYLQLTLGTGMPRNSSDLLDDSVLNSAPFNTSNYTQGYLVGKFPTSFPDTTPPTVDFRAVYFGQDLRYSAGANSGSLVLASGSPVDQTAWI